MNLDTVAKTLGTRAPRMDYLVHVDDLNRIAYFETPKVACTSIKKFMQEVYVGERLSYVRQNDVHDRQKSPLRRLSTLPEDEVDAVFFGSYRRFSFVRNPYSRVLSAYLDKLVKSEWERQRHLPTLGFAEGAHVSLLEFLRAIENRPSLDRDIHYAAQTELLLADRITYDFIGSFETFAEDFARLADTVFGQAAIPSEEYAGFGKQHATGAFDRLTAEFGDTEIGLVRKIFADDFDLLGYDHNITSAGERPSLHGLKISPKAVRARRPGPDETLVSVNARLERREITRPLAIAELRAALADGVDSAPLRARLAHMLLAENQTKQACQVATTGLEHYPETFELMTALGHGFKKDGDLDRARAQWAELRRAHPAAPIGWIEGCIDEAQGGDPDSGAELLMTFLSARTTPLPTWAWNGLVRAANILIPIVSEPVFPRLTRALYLRGGQAPDIGAYSALFTVIRAITARAKNKAEALVHAIVAQRANTRCQRSDAEDMALRIALGITFEPDEADALVKFLSALSFDSFVNILSARTSPIVEPDFLRTDGVEQSAILSLPRDSREDTKKVLVLKYARSDDYAAEYRALTGRDFVALRTTPAPAILGDRKPLVAMCISGQLRGFRACFPTWKASRLFKECDVRVFVHTWEEVGVKRPIPQHAARVFSGEFLQVYTQEAMANGGIRFMESRYPHFFEAFYKSGKTDTATMRSAFEAVHAHVQPDENFKSFTNQEKMYYKISSCWDLAKSAGETFDLVIRLRPDRPLKDDSGMNWKELVEIEKARAHVYTDFSPTILPSLGLSIGDQIGVGNWRAMDQYSSAWAFCRRDDGLHAAYNATTRSHSTLALALADAGIQVSTIPDSLKLGPLTDAPPPDLRTLRDALRKDVAQMDGVANRLLLAMEADIARAGGRAPAEAEEREGR